MKDTIDIMNEWDELIDQAKCDCVFGEPLDIDLFRECMKDACQCFFPENQRKEQLEKEEIMLYGLVVAYSKLPNVTDSENSTLYEASLLAASDFESTILRPSVIRLNGSKMEYAVRIIEDEKEVYNQNIAYDFETGDLSDYIELIENGYQDYR